MRFATQRRMLNYLNSCFFINDAYIYLCMKIFKFYTSLINCKIIIIHSTLTFLSHNDLRANEDSSWSTNNWNKQLLNFLLTSSIFFWFLQFSSGFTASFLTFRFKSDFLISITTSLRKLIFISNLNVLCIIIY